MKNLMKLLMVTVVITMASESFAQAKKGDFVLSGSSGIQAISSNAKYIYDGKTNTEDKTTTLSFTPSFAYFVVDNLAIGLASNLTSTIDKEEAGNKYVSSSTMIIPTFLYYFPVEGRIMPIVQLGAGLVSQTFKYIPKSGNDEKMSASGLVLNFGGGVAYFVKEHISLNLGLSYTAINLTDGDDNKSKMKQGNFGTNVGLSIYF